MTRNHAKGIYSDPLIIAMNVAFSYSVTTLDEHMCRPWRIDEILDANISNLR